MHINRFLLTLGLASSFLMASAVPVLAATESVRSKACWAQADAKELHGAERTKFHATCLQGALGAVTPTHPAPHSEAAQALTAPSGADRATRSKQCAAEADRKATGDNSRESIRLACLASAAPPNKTGTPTHPPTPTPAKSNLDTLPRQTPNN